MTEQQLCTRMETSPFPSYQSFKASPNPQLSCPPLSGKKPFLHLLGPFGSLCLPQLTHHAPSLHVVWVYTQDLLHLSGVSFRGTVHSSPTALGQYTLVLACLQEMENQTEMGWNYMCGLLACQPEGPRVWEWLDAGVKGVCRTWALGGGILSQVHLQQLLDFILQVPAQHKRVFLPHPCNPMEIPTFCPLGLGRVICSP